jgi:hypothetical protein
MVALDYRREGAEQVTGNVALGTTGRDRVSEHAAAILEGSVCCLVGPALLDMLDDAEQLHRLDVANRLLAEPGKDVELEPADDLLAVTWRPRW